jgi:hypothetical protein
MHKVHQAYLLLKTIECKLGAAKKVVSLFTLDSFNKALYDEVHFWLVSIARWAYERTLIG